MGNQGWVKVAEPKSNVAGPGSFFDETGANAISSDTLIRYWRNGNGLKGFLTIFALLWNAVQILALWNSQHRPFIVNHHYYQDFAEAYSKDPSVLVFLLFPIFGVVVAYFAICMWINRTRISLAGDQVLIKRGPLPWWGSKLEISKSQISQAYVQTYSPYEENRRPVTAFRVMLQMRNGADCCLDKGFSNYSDARILEQWIESRLGLTDQVVPGESGT